MPGNFIRFILNCKITFTVYFVVDKIMCFQTFFTDLRPNLKYLNRLWVPDAYKHDIVINLRISEKRDAGK